jgi:hypothetical protein
LVELLVVVMAFELAVTMADAKELYSAVPRAFEKGRKMVAMWVVSKAAMTVVREVYMMALS